LKRKGFRSFLLKSFRWLFAELPGSGGFPLSASMRGNDSYGFRF